MDESAESSSSFQNLNNTIAQSDKNKTPCLKHAVSNFADKSTDLSSTASLCKNCSKTMVSYIFLIQEVLDNLAKTLYCREDPNCCVQCLRQEFSANATKCNQSAVENKTETIANTNEVHQKELSSEVPQKSDINEIEVKSTYEDKTSKPCRKPSSRRNSRRLSRELRGIEKEPLQKATAVSYRNQEDWKVNFLYNVSPSTAFSDFRRESSEDNGHKGKPITILNQEYSSSEQPLNDLIENNIYQNKQIENVSAHDYTSIVATETLPTSFNDEAPFFNRKEQPTGMSNISFIEDYKPDAESAFEQFVDKENFLESYIGDEGTAPFSNCDMNKEPFSQPKTEENSMEAQKQNISMSLENIPSAVQKQNVSMGLKKIPTTVQKQNVSMDFKKIPTTVQDASPAEAFVTICRNNSEALGCLVIGSSLLLSRTSKALCVLVFDGIHTKLQELLSSVFHVVQNVAILESSELIETQGHQRNLEKLEKLNIWRLVQFNKCVFLNPDTLVLRNCDELFNHDELSAVPDNGWPDCFNSGVFVFVPSLSTFAQMEEMIRKQEHNDDGDQMFLNSFFTSWSRDLSKKLSFMYNLNLIGATTYTYATAFHKFGQNAKIVQFSGYFKPWHVRFCNETNQIVDASNILSTSLRFFYEWINVFRVSVLRLFPQNVYSTIFAQKTISVEEISRLLCLPERYDDINHRTFIDQTQENLKINNFEEVVYQKSRQGFSIYENRLLENKLSSGQNDSLMYQELQQESTIVNQPDHIHESSDDLCVHEKSLYSFPLLEAEPLLPSSLLNQSLPGSDSGNYEGMKVWEQGKMDYEGADNSENIIKRLQLLMQ